MLSEVADKNIIKIKSIASVKDEPDRPLDLVRVRKLYDPVELASYKYSDAFHYIPTIVNPL